MPDFLGFQIRVDWEQLEFGDLMTRYFNLIFLNELVLHIDHLQTILTGKQWGSNNFWLEFSILDHSLPTLLIIIFFVFQEVRKNKRGHCRL